eukprot:9375543-Pyramimonas_sp.AAC.1
MGIDAMRIDTTGPLTQWGLTQEELRDSLSGLDAAAKLHVLYTELAGAARLALGQPFVQIWLKWLQAFSVDLKEHWK